MYDTFNRLCNIAYESRFVPNDWRSAVTVPLYKGKGGRTECKNYRGISLLCEGGKVYAGIVVDIVSKSLIDDEQGSFR